MKTLEKPRLSGVRLNGRPRRPAPVVCEPPGGESQMERFSDEGRRVIDEVLSSDSEATLRRFQQRGGE